MNYDWSSLGLDIRITSIINDKFKFPRMTPVQAAAIPLLMKQKDVTVEAVTGSGKTLAFILPIIQMVLRKRNQMQKCEPKVMGLHDVFAIIISPTIELARQSFTVLNEFVRDDSLKQEIKAVHFVGGPKAFRDEEKYIKYGGNVIVSTPGRLAELLEKSVQLRSSVKKHLEVLVLDEADQLLSMGFETTISEILRKVPKQRRTCLFSATQTKQLEQLIRAGLRNPVKVEIKTKNQLQSISKTGLDVSCDEKQINSTGLNMSPFLKNFFIEIPAYSSKLSLVINFILHQAASTKTLIFFSTCAQVDYFSKVIDHFVQLHSNVKNSVPILKMHRKLRRKRSAMFAKFSEVKSGVLLCTDVMARGIDIKNIDWVIHFDLPNTLQHYIHRSGRSGHQVGQSGNSILLILPHEQKFIELCLQKNIDLKLFQGNLFERDQEPITCKAPKQMPNEDNDLNRKEVIVVQDFDVTKYMKDEARDDCSFYELAMTAFVSFIRTYSTKNVLSQVLFDQLDVISLVNCFGLLKIPIMPELRGKLKSSNSKFIRQSGDRDIVKTHIEELKGLKGVEDKREGTNFSQVKRKKMRKKIKDTKLKGKRKKQLIDELEFNELADDMRMIKKLKQGKVSEEQFDEHFSF